MKKSVVPVFIPSGWNLEQQVKRAMRLCDHDIEQTRLAHEAREDARIARAWTAEAKARHYARIQRGS